MSTANKQLAEWQQQEKALQEQIKALQDQAKEAKENSVEQHTAVNQCWKLETELKEVQEKIANEKEHVIESKIETHTEIAETAVEKLADHFGLEGIADPVVGGAAANIAVIGINAIRNHEATEAFVKGWVNEKVESIKDFIAEKFPGKEQMEMPPNHENMAPENSVMPDLTPEMRESRKGYDQEFNNMYNKHDEALAKLTNHQVDEIRRTGEQSPEMAAKFREEQRLLKENQMKEFAAIENRENDSRSDLIVKQLSEEYEKSATQINEKYDKKLESTEKALRMQTEQIEKRLEGQEKEQKLNELKKLGEQEKAKIEEKRNAELGVVEKRKETLEKVQESTKNSDSKERLAEIEKLKQMEIQRQIEEQNRQREELYRQRS